MTALSWVYLLLAIMFFTILLLLQDGGRKEPYLPTLVPHRLDMVFMLVPVTILLILIPVVATYQRLHM